MSKGITMSKEFGVNPSVQVCPCCGKDIGVLLLGTSYKVNGKVAQAPPKMATHELCDNCKQVIENGGTFFIEVRDGESGKSEPYRTGRIIGVKTEWADKTFPDHKAINYMEHTLFEALFGAALKKE